ncbi:BIG1-domain-containing protein [Saitoella complicata NRRL Y-17804]|uniref:Protein BIG1 n=1 Tax=Saitoella complicata (strain BCRC 22490 / CBS 7301 / JCM 7358 / NBRC 10748 / NRRL Y-17804) TaxID=698492 RepID=A0A0E9NCE1_SAICN|nr:BIG1-domain-containing protein [Saitoella complicata NRRL Y-17804]ODQ55251.1 BIG1-domain-containing protein [Saitoella complicata NRRL Y-17804]GAO47085.1 hypothetical protein G7K_1297-t1 [Saitoella complicata NRRL Y-17804]
MRLSTTALTSLLLAGSAAVVSAFEDSSPFLLLSSQRYPSVSDVKSSSILTASHFESVAYDAISTCSSDTYILVSQPGVHAADFGARNSPHLKRALETAESVLQVPYGRGAVDAERLEQAAVQCGAEVLTVDAQAGTFPVLEEDKKQVIKVEFAPLPREAEARADAVAQNDGFLYALLSSLGSSADYTLVYTSTPPADSPMHVKRSNVITQRRLASLDATSNLKKTGLFATYQFVTPAIFMSLLVSFILLAILSVAISTMAGMKVSYRAFDTDKASGLKKNQ